MSRVSVSRFREISQNRADEFLTKGYLRRYFFPHRTYYLPKCGPDGLLLARRMCGVQNPNNLWEVVLYADLDLLDQFPKALFFDDDLIWHQQHFGKIGQVATANLVVLGDKLYGMNYISDLVQRISIKRPHKTKIENRFKGWPYMLLNSVLNFAVENNITTIYSQTADSVLENADPNRSVRRELFDRIYDRTVKKYYRGSRKGKWWVLNVGQNKKRIVVPTQNEETTIHERTLCLCHDIERGFGHFHNDSVFVKSAYSNASQRLKQMLRIEKEMGVYATYHVLGCLFEETREMIEQDGHCLAFHSYNHSIDHFWPLSKLYHQILNRLKGIISRTTGGGYVDQLTALREVDYRIKGFRPPQSKITRQLKDKNLCYHNFEWLASSTSSLGTWWPKMENRIVKIPILFDDFEMYAKKMTYDAWENMAINSILENEFAAFCLHDCYAHLWLPHYKKFLRKISQLGEFKTLDNVSNEVILSNSK